MPNATIFSALLRTYELLCNLVGNKYLLFSLDMHHTEILSFVQPGGRVIWRSASRRPGYARCIESSGFKGIIDLFANSFMSSWTCRIQIVIKIFYHE
jgi:hypothetical protein